MARATLKSLIWSPRYVGIYKCGPETSASGRMAVTQLKLAGGQEIDDDPDLHRVLETLQQDFVNKRPVTAARNPTTRIVAFRSPEPGQPNEGRALLESLLGVDASDLKAIGAETRKAVKRYVEVVRARPGVLIFLVSRGRFGDSEPEDCVFVFKCDFEPISRTDKRHLFERVKEAIVEKTRKAALYPFFARGRFDRRVARVFDDRGETGYWIDFLELGERAGEPDPVVQATRRELDKFLPPEKPEPPPPTAGPLPPRSLRDGKRSVAPEHRLSKAQAKKAIAALAARGLDPKIRLRLDQVEVIAPLSRLLESWTIAEEGDEAAILVKGSELENRTPLETVLDFMELEGLEETLFRFFPRLA